MYHVKILPDEYWCGFRGRLQQLNVYRDATKTSSALRTEFTQLHKENQLDIGLLLAASLNMSKVDFWRNHNFSTSLFAPVRSQGAYSRCPRLRPSLQFLRYSSTPRIGALCPDCIEEDKFFWGFSYWRRTHQIPGIGLCPKHASPLYLISSRDVFDHSPSMTSDAVAAWSHTTYAQFAVLSRYAEIAISLLDQHCGYKKNERVTAEKIGFHISETHAIPASELANEIRAMFPAVWLGTHYPALLDPDVWPLNSSTTGIGLIPIILVMAILFDTAENALAYWDSYKRVPLWPSAYGSIDETDMPADEEEAISV